MTKKPAPEFLPTPRLRPLNTPDTTAALQEATRDLGFGRPTSARAPDPAPAPEAPEAASVAVEASAPKPAAISAAPAAQAPNPAPKPRAPVAKSPRAEKASPAADAGSVRRAPSLRIEVDDALWDAIRLAAIKRRVSVKYLIYEALAAQGFEIDMNAIPEDGRRAR